ncbi:MAG: PEP-CTERM-box response regulator transcription factor [Steroidobacteraceae bacterium]
MSAGFTDSAPATRRLLIIAGDAALRAQLKWGFEGLEMLFAENRQQVGDALHQHQPQVVLQDLRLSPDADVAEGFAMLARILELVPATKVIVVAGQHERDNAMKAVAAGAWAFHDKPADADALRLLVRRAFEAASLEQELGQLRDRLMPGSFEGIIAVDRAMQNVCRMIEKVAPAEVAVLILGESGTGKELLAHAVHNLSGRAGKRFMTVNCAAIPEPLLEAELFGYEKGVAGKIEQADGGTLFLDEVGDMPLALQAKLLRFLQNKAVERMGAHHETAVDVRIVAATNQNLAALMAGQRFRQELFYRLSEVTVNVPPLRERPADILAIAQAVLLRQARIQGKNRRGFTDAAAQVLTAHNWPGNVRELENKIRAACLLGDDALVSAADLGLASGYSAGPMLNLKEVRHRAERDAVGRAMGAAGGNISRAAEMLGVSRPTLYDLLARHDPVPVERRDTRSPESAGGVA